MTPNKPVRPKRQGNKLYPLPDNYYSLTKEEQRAARVNACCLQETPEDLVYAWHFFVNNYLLPLPLGIWFYPPYFPSPPAHYRFVHDLGHYPRNVQAFPRAFGKSKLLKSVILLWLLTRPFFKMLLVKVSDDFVEQDFMELMWQMENNEFILRDFGESRAPKGQGKWSTKRLWLRNGAQLVGRSVLGKMLGSRPDFVAFDDAEFDPLMRVSPALLTEQMTSLYYGHVVPMMEEGRSVLLLGTLHNRKFFIYRQATISEEEDPRVGFFNRVVLGAADGDDLLWREKWDHERLAEMKSEMGSDVYNAMMMNRPGTESERLLRLHDRFGWYNISGVDERWQQSPLASHATLKAEYFSGTGTPTEEQHDFGEFVSKMYRVLIADPVKKGNLATDYACAMVIGIDRRREHKDDWFLLDMRYGRPSETDFIDWLWEMGSKWLCRFVGIESYSTQQRITEKTEGKFIELAKERGWAPRVIPIRYTGEFSAKGFDQGKAQRICGLAWRFEANKIKLPRHLSLTAPIRELVFEIENFTMNLALLAHEDPLDTLAMAQFVPRPSGSLPEPEAQPTAIELLEKGETMWPGTNIPLMSGLNASDLTEKALATLERKRMQRLVKQKAKDVRRKFWNMRLTRYARRA